MSNIEKRYFRLFPDVAYLKGASGSGSINLLASRSLFRVAPDVGMLLDLAKGGLAVEVIADRAGMRLADVRSIFDALAVEDVGAYYTAPVFVEPLRKPDVQGHNDRSDMRSVRVRLSGRCGGHCTFCTPGIARASLRPCMGCRRDEEGQTLAVADIAAFLGQAAGQGCRSVLFDVPDAALIPETVLHAVEVARTAGCTGIQMMFGMLPPPDMLDRVTARGVVPVFQVFSYDPARHDAVRGAEGDFSRLRGMAARLRQQGAEFRLTYVRCCDEDDLCRASPAFSDWGASSVFVDTLDRYPCDEASFYEAGVDPANYELFVSRLETPVCPSAVFTLDCDGGYRTCPAGHDPLLGRLHDGGTLGQKSALSRIEASWTALDKRRSVCGQCDFRAACTVCGAPGAQGDFPPARGCGFDVASGEWPASAAG